MKRLLFYSCIVLCLLDACFSNCPEGCKCGYTIFCRDRAVSMQELIALGDGTFKYTNKTRIMVFSYQNFTEFDMCIFKRFKVLAEFVLTFSKLKMVPRNLDCIKGLGIQNVQLNNNEIEELAADDFKGYQSVSYLRLNYNKIKRLRADTFQHLERVLDLRLEGNQIEYIEPNTFRGIENLRSLGLHENLLSIIPNNVFQPIKNIGRLNLNNNRLTTLGGTAFAYLRVVKLDLRSNQLGRISSTTFLNSTMDSLNLDDNPLECFCQTLLSLRRVSSTIFGKCNIPKEFKSKSPTNAIRIMTDPCTDKLYCQEDPKILDHLKDMDNRNETCPVAPEPKKDSKITMVLLITIGVLVMIIIASTIVGYSYKKRYSGTALVTSDVNMNGFQGNDGKYIRDTTHYVETLEEEAGNKDVTIKSVRRKISNAIFGPSRKQSIPNTALVNGISEPKHQEPVKHGSPRRKKTVFVSPPVIEEEEGMGDTGPYTHDELPLIHI